MNYKSLLQEREQLIKDLSTAKASPTSKFHREYIKRLYNDVRQINKQLVRLDETGIVQGWNDFDRKEDRV